MLEMAHYTSSPRMLPPSYRMGIFEIPDNAPLVRLEKEDWPQDWSDYPFPLSTQKIGTDWLQRGAELGLIVPSCAVPGGLGETMLVNPLHNLAGEIRLVVARSGTH